MPSDVEQKSAHELLGLNNSDADDVANSSDEEEEGSKAANISQHRTKRRRMEPTRAGDDGSDNDDEAEESEGEVMDERFSGRRKTAAFAEETEKKTKKQAVADKEPDESITTNPSKLKPLTATQLAASKEATAKTGVVYLSRIPPFMKPQKVRDLLARFGEVGRVFLAPEDPKAHAKRVRFGGNKKRNFTEGWVEFKNKKDAMICAETLNTQIVGGKKRSYYYDDVWNMKYLPKFKWHHLQAQIAYENASRQAKMRAEIAHETRINKTYLRNVERAKMVENMEKKRKADDCEDEGHNPGDGSASKIEVRRQFRQHKTKGRAAEKSQGKQSSEKVKNLLSKVF